MVKSDNLAPQKARLNFHQGILNSMLFNLFRPMPVSMATFVFYGNSGDYYLSIGVNKSWFAIFDFLGP